MSTDEEIDFYFVTKSSGSLNGLLDRLDVSKKNAALMALTYYALYVHGLHQGGRALVMTHPAGKKVWELDDQDTPEHARADLVSLTVNMSAINLLTRHARLHDAADTLTRAFVLLEKVRDIYDSGWGLGLYDKKSGTVDPITLKIELEEAASEATEKVIAAMHPPKPFLH